MNLSEASVLHAYLASLNTHILMKTYPTLDEISNMDPAEAANNIDMVLSKCRTASTSKPQIITGLNNIQDLISSPAAKTMKGDLKNQINTIIENIREQLL